MPIEIECPSGLKGKVRNLTGRDGRYLADREIQRQGATTDYILSSCWTETIDPGPYSVTASGPNWAKVLQGDRAYALIQIRIATHGEIYAFKAQCANQSCVRRRFEWEIDLDELPVRQLPESSRAILANGENQFMVRVPGTEETRALPEPEEESALMHLKRRRRKDLEIVPDTGDTVLFSLPVGSDEPKAARMNREAKKRKDGDGNELVSALSLRIKEIAGLSKPKEIFDYLESLSLAQLAQMLDRFDDFDCGVETTIEIQCPECDCLQEVELPFDRNFFLPRKERVAS